MKMKWKSTLVHAIAVSLFAVMASPHAGPHREAQTIYNKRPDSHLDPVSNYLRIKEDELRNNRSTLDRLRMSQDTDHFYELVKDQDVFAGYPVVGDTPEQRAEVIDALNATAAQYLSSVGMTAAKLAASQDAGFDVVRSVAKVVAGGAEFRDLMAVSEHAVLGTVGATSTGATGSSFSVNVVDGSSGLQGRSITLAGGHQSSAREGQECIFFLSESLQRFRSAGSGNLATRGGLAQQFEPFCRTKDGYVSTNAYIQGGVDEMDVHRLMTEKKLASANRR